jgi:hypothetical protein
MKVILNCPVFPVSLEKSLSIRFFSLKICYSIYHLFFFSLLFPVSSYFLHLCNASPFILESFIQLRCRPYFTHFYPPMPFIRLFVLLNIFLISARTIKEILNISTNRWIIVFL